jgi:purine-nucleoside phosphorylase
VLAMQGRFHYYEGKTMEEVILPVRVMAALGIHTLIITNAAGGIDPAFSPGDLMLIEDHLNLSGASPLRGSNPDSIGPRFPDMTDAYDPALRQLALQKAKALNIPVRTGVYAMMAGPNYETPAEIRMLRLLGAHAVGMSTVPEVIAAAHAGVKVLAISCITNMAAGILNQPLHHQEVVETAEKARHSMAALLGALTAALPGR